MTETEYNNAEKISRDYVDNFSVKDMAINEIMPKYYEEEMTNLTVGTTGMLTEMVGTIAEDGFNTSSTLLMETFPTRANMENSIYSNAAIFQLSNVFSEAARCDFLIVIPESDIIRNFVTKQGEPYSYFFIDKDTTIYIEDIPFVLDYDIAIRAIWKETQNGYIYSAKYLMPSNTEGVFKNSISPITDPYIKIRKTANGLIVLQVNMGQYRRKYKEESIIDNATINFPTVNVGYSDKIAAIDIIYQEPGDTTKEQMDLRVRFSQPLKTPFCYYRKTDDDIIELSFTTKDTYFQPEFNSTLDITTYSTMGASGNFDIYTGENISLTKATDKYQYDYSWAVSVKPLSGSAGGKNAMSKEALQDLTVEGFATANALTIEHDLQLYFNNYKHRYGSNVLFLKKRDDPADRLYSAFIYTKKDDYFYPANTLTLNTNLLYLDKKGGEYYNMDPGFLFTYKGIDTYQVYPIYYVLDRGVNTMKYYKKNSDGTYSLYSVNNEKLNEVKHEEWIFEEEKAGRLQKNPDQYYVLSGGDYHLYNPDGTLAKAVYKNLDGSCYYKYRDRLYYVYDAEGKLHEEFEPLSQKSIDQMLYEDAIIPDEVDVYNDALILSQDELLMKFRSGDVLYVRKDNGDKYIDYLMDSEKELQAKIDYLNYFESSPEKQKDPTMTISDYIFNYTFKDYKNDRGIDNRLTVFDENVQEISNQHEFLFTNPFLLSVTKSSGLVGYYMTAMSQSSTLDFIKENDVDAFTQFITYTLKVDRDISKDKKYTFELTVLPSVTISDECPIIDKTIIFDPENPDLFVSEKEQLVGANVPRDLMSYKKELLVKNDLRIILSFHDSTTDELIGYLEMIPTSKKVNDQIQFKAEFITDDYVTRNNVFRAVHRCPYCGTIKHDSVNVEGHVRNEGGFYRCMTKDCPGHNGFKEGIINTHEIDDIFIPLENAIVKVNMLYRDPLEETHPTNNDFSQFDPTYEGYHWTNVYSTILEPITFIKPMNMLHSNIEYKDYHNLGVDALDCYIHDIPFLKYSLIAYRHGGPEVTKIDEEDDVEQFQYFLNSYTEHYQILNEAKTLLRNNTNIDTKFYNTYGKSTNFVIGEEGELINTVNITIKFDVWLIPNTDQTYAENTLKTFIKEYVESINNEGTNDLYISNLIREIENNLAFVHHLKFQGINDYDTSYQAIKNRAISLVDLSKEERRHFVPDLLTVNRSNIILKFDEID